MGKGKPRHNPDKPINYCCGTGGDWSCQWLDEGIHKYYCEKGIPKHIVETVCHGNPYNCCKVTYRQWSGKSSRTQYPDVDPAHNMYAVHKDIQNRRFNDESDTYWR